MKKSLIYPVLLAFVLSFGVLTAFPAYANTDSSDSTNSSSSSKHHHKQKHSKSKKKHSDTDTSTNKSTNQGGNMFKSSF